MIYLGEKEEKSKDTSSQVMEKLLKTRTIFISGEINQELAEKVSTQLLILQEMGDEPIKIFINSQGGHVEAGDTIHDMIKFVVILAVIVLITIIALMLGRALRGPTVFNRMNALGVISADTIILIVLFGYLDGRIDMYVDIAISYAILGFVGSIAIAKFLGGKKL